MAETSDKDDLLSQGKRAFQRCQDAESENRLTALSDIRFSQLGEQWPDAIRKQREMEGRPCLTINKLKAFIRQVVNDARQNKPSIKVHPVDDFADPKTAEIINGLIRNIEYTSNADVAYDTAVEASVSGGFGYWRITLDYAYDDSFDLDLKIERVANQFSVYGDPASTCADSSDWNVAFVVNRMTKDDFKRQYKGKKNTDGEPACVDFDSDAWTYDDNWLDDDFVMVGEWWQREEVERVIMKATDGRVFYKDEIEADEDLQLLIEIGQLQFETGPDGQPLSRTVRSYKVTQTIMSGADVLEVNDWPGRYIPLVPVYGDEIIVEGKRYFRSLINPAVDAQQMFNFWRSASTEMVALAPKVPWIGRKGAFESDNDRWQTANTTSHAYLEYDGPEAPVRQPLDVGPAAGALQEALNASDDMKAITGLYDASLGARSNETSGKAIMARQREGDVATFHFIDNLSRAIRHTGCILIDLIPKVYNTARVVRVIGEDGSQETKAINQPAPVIDPQTGQPQMQPVMGPDGQPMQGPDGNPVMEAVMAMHDLTVGKYDLIVSSGPSFTSRREEAAFQMTELVRAFPQVAPVILDVMAKNFDWPGADEIAERLAAMNSQNQQQIPPQVQQMIEQSQQAIQQLSQEVEALKADKSIDQFNAETQRMKVEGDLDNNRAKIQVDMIKAADSGEREDMRFQQQAYNPARQG
jgi:hypothetical protein